MKPIALGSDHAGFALKEAVKRVLAEMQQPYEDYGTTGEEAVDYPEYGVRVGRAVASGRSDRGILICGSGIGMSMVANKVKGVRAALCYNSETARLSRAHNDANVLVLGGRLISEAEAGEIVKIWLKTPFEGGRHQRRIDLIKTIEEQSD